MKNANADRQSRGLAPGVRGLAAFGLLLLAACAAPAPIEESDATFYPKLPQLPRLQFLMTLNSEEQLGGGASGLQDFLTGKQDTTKSLNRAWDIAHEKGKLYVVDRNLKAIVIIDLDKGTFDIIKDTKGGPLRDPISVFVTPDGHKYVADKSRQQILVFNERDEFLRAYGAEKQFVPTDVVVFADRVFVSDIRENEVEVLDKASGEVVTKIGGTGEKEGYLRRPTHLALDGDGNVYVTDFMNFRIQKFDKTGTFLKTIGEAGTFPGATPRPKGIAIDKAGFLYAVDAAFELVQVFDEKTADVVLGFGKFESGPGGTYLPAGIHIDYDNIEYFQKYIDKNFRASYLIYVTNQAGDNRLNVYAFGEWIGPPPAGMQAPAKTPSPAAPTKSK